MKALRFVALLGAFSLTMFSGCGLFASHRSSGVQAEHVVKVELFEYTWGQESPTVRRATVVNSADRSEVIDDLVKGFTDVPVTSLEYGTAQKVVGHEALGVRYHLDDGSTVDVTRIFIWYYDVVVIWPDGTVNHVTGGAPNLVDYYGQFGTIDEVPASDKPKAELPR